MTQAIAELRNCAGTQFDPTVVDAIANLVIGLLWPSAPATASTSQFDPVPDRASHAGRRQRGSMAYAQLDQD